MKLLLDENLSDRINLIPQQDFGFQLCTASLMPWVPRCMGFQPMHLGVNAEVP